MKYKLYATIMYGTDEKKLKLFKTRQNYLSYKLYVMSGLFSKYTLLYSRLKEAMYNYEVEIDD